MIDEYEYNVHIWICFFIDIIWVFGKTLVHEFHIFYSNTEWYLLFSDSASTSAQYENKK